MKVETIGNATLYLGDCRENQTLAITPKRKPWAKSAIKAVVSCSGCQWTWKPSTGFGHERCPKCQKVIRVQDRKYESRLANISGLKAVKKKKSGTDWERIYRFRAVLLVGGGQVQCVRCGCDNPALIEINHKNGGGGKELRALGNKFHRQIAKLERTTSDLELLCRPCNAIHFLEMKHGPLPYKIIWGPSNVA